MNDEPVFQDAEDDGDADDSQAVTFDEETSTHPKDRAIPASYGESGGLQQ